MSPTARARWLATSAYEMAEPRRVQRFLRRYPALVAVLDAAPAALAPFFPDASLRLDVAPGGLVLVIPVADPADALTGPLVEVDRTWWAAQVPHCRGRLTLDVEELYA